MTALFRLPVGVFLLLLLGAMLATAEIGRRIGAREREDCDSDARAHVNGLQSAVLGLLALMLGFTFSMAVLRYDTNRDMIVAEANAIETAYMRADIAAEPQRSTLRRLLKSYVDTRIAFYEAGRDLEKRGTIVNDGARLHAEMWRQAAESAARAPTCTTALLVQAVNQAIDFQTLRLDAARNHVPAEIKWLLTIMAIVATGLLGYVSGFGNRLHKLPTAIVLLMFALVISAIVDLDRPMSGVIRGGQDSMLELQHALR